MQMRYRSVFTMTAALICLIALACGGPPQNQTPNQNQASPSGTVALVPLSAYKVEWLSNQIPTTMEANKEYQLTVSLKNAGDSAWPSKGTNGSVVNQVSISYHWLAESGDKAVHYEGHRTSLPHDIAPGESLTANNVTVTAPDPGKYRLQVTLVHEGVTWFEQQGAKTLIVPVTVH